MRKSRQETAETRQRIVEAASREFRTSGIEETGLDDLMAAAGLTHGGFYKHFGSKEQVIQESLALSDESWCEELQTVFLKAPGRRGLQALTATFLSADHLDNAAGGCPFVALGSEITRASKTAREEMTKSFLKIADLIAYQIEGMSPATAKNEAIWILSTMIGAMTMARITTDPDISASILHEARKRIRRSYTRRATTSVDPVS